MTDLVYCSWVLVDDFTSAAFSTLLVNERSQLSFVMHNTVMFVQVVSTSKHLLTEAATEVRDITGSVRFLGLMNSTPWNLLILLILFVFYFVNRIRYLG